MSKVKTLTELLSDACRKKNLNFAIIIEDEKGRANVQYNVTGVTKLRDVVDVIKKVCEG